ncbi:MAG: 4'-phosphopantetheinyl transferase superfamily protein [Oscillospiraceae bacterium]|nr:4'-phosphopantetheinyl transferase superfamily protein [Oscillospiraceae bacterium]
MLYVFGELHRLDDKFIALADGLLSAQRKDKTARLAAMPCKIQSVASYILLRMALSSEYGIEEAVDFKYCAKGKPTLVEYPDIHFNISHCKCAVACAVFESQIGVDVQNIVPVSDKVARYALSDEEYAIFEGLSSFAPERDTENVRSALPPESQNKSLQNLRENKEEYFCKIWTIKESYLKKTGDGIGKRLNSLRACQLENIRIFKEKDFYCSVTEQNIKIVNVSFEDLLAFINKKN